MRYVLAQLVYNSLLHYTQLDSNYTASTYLQLSCAGLFHIYSDFSSNPHILIYTAYPTLTHTIHLGTLYSTFDLSLEIS